MSEDVKLRVSQSVSNNRRVYGDEIERGLVKIIIIPDIASVNYGRGVGYRVEEIIVRFRFGISGDDF